MVGTGASGVSLKAVNFREEHKAASEYDINWLNNSKAIRCVSSAWREKKNNGLRSNLCFE